MVSIVMEDESMAKNTSFILGEHFSNFIETQVSQGRYGSASETIEAVGCAMRPVLPVAFRRRDLKSRSPGAPCAAAA